MSLAALALTLRTTVGDSLAKLVLLTLADAHNDHTGQCFVSQAQIGAEAELPSSTVNRKLQWLEEEGFISREQQTRPDGTRAITHYRLLYVPELHLPMNTETARRRRSMPDEDWKPQPKTIDRLRQRYPHHDIDEDYLVREFVGWCRAQGQTYADLEAAFANSAERQLRRQTAGIVRLRAGAGKQRRAAGGVAGAIRDLLDAKRAGDVRS